MHAQHPPTTRPGAALLPPCPHPHPQGRRVRLAARAARGASCCPFAPPPPTLCRHAAGLPSLSLLSLWFCVIAPALLSAGRGGAFQCGPPPSLPSVSPLFAITSGQARPSLPALLLLPPSPRPARRRLGFGGGRAASRPAPVPRLTSRGGLPPTIIFLQDEAAGPSTPPPPRTPLLSGIPQPPASSPIPHLEVPPPGGHPPARRSSPMGRAGSEAAARRQHA